MKIRNVFFAIVLGMFLTSGPVNAATNPWGQYGQNGQNTGMSNYTGPAAIEYTWQVPLSEDNSDSFVSPVVDSTGTVFILDAKRSQRHYDGEWWTDADGKWFYNYSGVERSRVKAISSGGGSKWNTEVLPTCTSDIGRTSLALGTDGYLYVSCSERDWSVIYAMNAATGVIEWELQLDDVEAISVGSLALDSQNKLYLTYKTWKFVDGRWRGYHQISKFSWDGTNGTRVWDFELGDGYADDVAGPVLSEIDEITNKEERVYVYRLVNEQRPEGYFRGAKIYAINTEFGTKEWDLDLPWGGAGWQAFTSFTVDKAGTIWLASYYKPDPANCYGKGEKLIGITNGAISHEIPFEGEINCGTHVRVGPSGTIYLTYDDVYWGSSHWDGTRWLYRVRIWDGSRYVYKYRYHDGTQYIYVDSPKGGLVAYDPDAINPEDALKWKFELPDSFEANASPAIDAAENIYFASSFGDRLYSINKDGVVNWEMPIAEDDELVYGVAPVIGRGGSIYVMSYSTLYAIDHDIDNDDRSNNKDNCLSVPNTDQKDANTNGIGDACDGDTDGDGKPDIMDNCPFISNASQDDLDKDGWGDVCDPCEGDDPENSCDSGEGDIPSDIGETSVVSNITETASVSFDPGFISGTTETYSVTVEGESAISNFAYGANQHNLGSVYTFSITPTPPEPGNFSSETVEITLTYDQGFMPEDGQMENNLDIYYYNTLTLEWEPQNADQNVDNNTLKKHVDHFSSYAVIMTENLVSDLIGVLKDIEIGNEGFKNSLRVKLEKAHDFYDEGKATAAGNILAAFINEVKAQSGKKIDSSSADVLIQLAQGLQSGS